MIPLKFNEQGLIPAVVQDYETNEVLMVAWANQEAVDRMMETGMTHFWSRSRNELWKKGETSGHFQYIKAIQTDCDSDTLLIRVRQVGNACHLDRPSCFADLLYGDIRGTGAIVPELLRVVRKRKDEPVEGSYTCKLFEDETKMCKKVVEEAAELALAVKDDSVEEMAWELADLIYHVMVLVAKTDLPMEKVYEKLSERRK